MVPKIIPTVPIIENMTLDILLKGIKDAPTIAKSAIVTMIVMCSFLLPRSYLFAIRNSLPEIVEKIAKIMRQEYTADSLGKKNCTTASIGTSSPAIWSMEVSTRYTTTAVVA